jgi:GDPmannose 4,6-dehydratase
MTKTAIITGVSGQDGAYLSQHLVGLGYRVIGLVRSYSDKTYQGLSYLQVRDSVILVECDLLDLSQTLKIMGQYQPDEIYNLSAQSSVSMSFKQTIGTFQYNTLSVLNLLEAIKLANPRIKLYQASSSEMYGEVHDLPITEKSVLHPRSPYAISKAAAHWLCVNYREAYSMFVCCGILFNHESYLRSEQFFVKKVIVESVKISRGTQKELRVGNLELKRDFGYAPEYVKVMHRMMQHSTPQDFLICSGHSVSLREIVEYIFQKLDIPLSCLVIDTTLYRPTDIVDSYGSNAHAQDELGWEYKRSFFDVLDSLLAEELTHS